MKGEFFTDKVLAVTEEMCIKRKKRIRSFSGAEKWNQRNFFFTTIQPSLS